MKTFSFRRMWRFCRLLLEQMCFYSFGKAAAVMLAVIVLLLEPASSRVMPEYS